MRYLANAFSLQMLTESEGSLYYFDVTPKDGVMTPLETVVFLSEEYGPLKSVIGHQDTANLLGVEMNRESITLESGDMIIVAQVIGGRLPEGATTLPDGVKIKFIMIQVQ